MQDLFVDKPGFIEVSTSLNDKKAAMEIAKQLVKKKLAACVQIIDNVTSIYRWQGKVMEENEILLIIKTNMNSYGKLAAFLKSVHPYDLPEIIVKQINEGSTQYLNWMSENIKD